MIRASTLSTSSLYETDKVTEATLLKRDILTTVAIELLVIDLMLPPKSWSLLVFRPTSTIVPLKPSIMTVSPTAK